MILHDVSHDALCPECERVLETLVVVEVIQEAEFVLIIKEAMLHVVAWIFQVIVFYCTCVYNAGWVLIDMHFWYASGALL